MINNLIKLRNKNFLIYGLGKTGESVVKFFKKAKVKNYYVWDDERVKNKSKKKTLVKLSKIINKADHIVLSPGISISKALAGKYLKKNFKKIITDLDIFYSLYPAVKTIVVTGTNGKSTTCKIIHNVLKNSKNYKTYLIGNIGTPVLNVLPLKKSICVIEASSFQLNYSKKIKPNHALITNISRDHLDWHGSYNHYINSKFNIFSHQTHSDFAYLENDNFIKKFKKKKFKSKLIKINKSIDREIKKNLKNEYFLNDAHKQNLKFAFFVTKSLKIRKKVFINTINNFKPLEHRNEKFMEKKNIFFVNDSKATSFSASLNALKSYKNIYWILGGQPKIGEKEKLKKNLFKRIKKVYLIGKHISFFKKKIDKLAKYKISKNIDAAIINISNDLKLSSSKAPKTVLLSPAGASFDQFKNFEQRGLYFKEKIKEYAKRNYF